MTVLDEYRAAHNAATEQAKATLIPGDRVSRTMCAGRKGTFTFVGWEKSWAYGKTVTDCPASAIYAVNGKPVSFFKWEGDIKEVIRLQQEARKAAWAERQGQVVV